MPSPLRKQHIALVGFAGSGKSSIGPPLAKKLRYAFVDTDHQVERHSRMSVSDIFALKGEAVFRRLERTEVRRACQSRRPSVIALGGGALLNRANQTEVFKTSVVIYLRCSQRELIRRLVSKADRPLLRGARPILESRVDTLMAARLPGYQKADLVVSVSSASEKEIVATILKQLEKYYAAH